MRWTSSCRHLLDAGDEVLVDSPGYYPRFGKLKLAKVEMLGVPRLADGPDLDALQALLKSTGPKVFFTSRWRTTPGPLPKAHRRLDMACGRRVFWWWRMTHLPPAAAQRPAPGSAGPSPERVIYVRAFPTLSAGLRVGLHRWGAAHPHQCAV